MAYGLPILRINYDKDYNLTCTIITIVTATRRK